MEVVSTATYNGEESELVVIISLGLKSCPIAPCRPSCFLQKPVPTISPTRGRIIYFRKQNRSVDTSIILAVLLMSNPNLVMG